MLCAYTTYAMQTKSSKKWLNIIWFATSYFTQHVKNYTLVDISGSVKCFDPFF